MSFLNHCVIACATLIFSSHAFASEPNFGAIAFSATTGATGTAVAMPSRDAARKQALNDCRRHANDCKVVSWFFGGACGAVAQGKNGKWGAGWAQTQNVADTKALRRCHRNGTQCVLKRQQCSG